MEEKKTTLGDIETTLLTKEFISMVMSMMPKNLKNLGSFNLPIQIGESDVIQGLSD